MPDDNELGRTASEQDGVELTPGRALHIIAAIRPRPGPWIIGGDYLVSLPMQVVRTGVTVPDDSPREGDIAAGKDSHPCHDARDDSGEEHQTESHNSLHAVTI